MKEPLYINASCSITRNLVVKDNTVLFRKEAMPVLSFLQAAYQHFAMDYPRFYKMDNLCKLGWLATEILLNGSFDKTRYAPEDTGLVFTNRSSSLDTDIKYYNTIKDIPSPALFVYTLPNIVLGEICIRHQFKGENDFFIFEDFNAGFIQQYVQHLMYSGALETCICGWLELLGASYHACLYLVEKDEKENALPFTEENIHKLYQITHGYVNDRFEKTDC